jgi:hypothetical protein
LPRDSVYEIDEAEEEKVIATVGQVEAIRGRIETLKAALSDYESRLSQSQNGNTQIRNNSPISSAPYDSSQNGNLDDRNKEAEGEKPSANEKESDGLKGGPNSATPNSDDPKDNPPISSNNRADSAPVESPNISQSSSRPAEVLFSSKPEAEPFTQS